jgi:glucan 1,3-beta-glucosidase
MVQPIRTDDDMALLGDSTTLGPGKASPGDPYWLQSIKHQGTAAYNPHPTSYQVFRNVKDFGAKGDGVTDDTAAIKLGLVISNLQTDRTSPFRIYSAAISSGGRCGGGTCQSSS